MKKLFNSLALIFALFILSPNLVSVSSVSPSNYSTLAKQARRTYQQFYSLCDALISMPNEINKNNLYRWKIKFVDTFKNLKKNESTKNALFFLLNFINCSPYVERYPLWETLNLCTDCDISFDLDREEVRVVLTYPCRHDFITIISNFENKLIMPSNQ